MASGGNGKKISSWPALLRTVGEVVGEVVGDVVDDGRVTGFVGVDIVDVGLEGVPLRAETEPLGTPRIGQNTARAGLMLMRISHVSSPNPNPEPVQVARAWKLR